MAAQNWGIALGVASRCNPIVETVGFGMVIGTSDFRKNSIRPWLASVLAVPINVGLLRLVKGLILRRGKP